MTLHRKLWSFIAVELNPADPPPFLSTMDFTVSTVHTRLWVAQQPKVSPLPPSCLGAHVTDPVPGFLRYLQDTA